MNKTYYKVGKMVFELVNDLRSFDPDDTIESWNDLSEERQKSMCRFIDDVLKNPTMTAEEMHVSWMDERLKNGWIYGEVTDRSKKIHNCLVPYEDLSVLQKAKDAIVIRVVNQYREELEKSNKTYMISIDFDGVIHDHSKCKFTNEWTIQGDLIPGAKEAINQLSEKYNVVVISTRCNNPDGRYAVIKWLELHSINVYDVADYRPPSLITVDDRAITFNGNWNQTLEDIKRFKPWYKI